MMPSLQPGASQRWVCDVDVAPRAVTLTLDVHAGARVGTRSEGAVVPRAQDVAAETVCQAPAATA